MRREEEVKRKGSKSARDEGKPDAEEDRREVEEDVIWREKRYGGRSDNRGSDMEKEVIWREK